MSDALDTSSKIFSSNWKQENNLVANPRLNKVEVIVEFIYQISQIPEL